MAAAPNVGIDIGGTKTAVALIAGREVVAHQRIPSAGRTGDQLVAAIAAAVLALRGGSGAPLPAAAGVGVAGRVDPRSGVVRSAPNLHWSDDFPLGERLGAVLDIPVVVLNDVQAAAYGESVYGAGRDARSMVALFVGTGIGSGIVDDGELLRGCTGSAGEWGHAVIDLRGPRCTCGNYGCLESYASGWGIAARARQAAEAEPAAAASLLARVEGELERLTTREVAAAAREGDPFARELMEQAAEALGAGIATIINALDPCRVVMGGGVVQGYPELVAMAERHVKARLCDSATMIPPLLAAQLGGHAGVVGAASWAARREGGARPGEH